MVAHICNPRRLRQEDHEFEASLSHTVRHCLKKEKENYLTRVWYKIVSISSHSGLYSKV
jgi:hypothetical protein